ncbi:MFS transporter [Brevibacillus dissolubilis]|uniref:MFS transporter n=1 Tax=Brevibacillus dissolubilis TaxID=1844116 RepID=UPI001115BAE2|nr:MFS transporter [Brevibacillus dissolubilis]
MTQWVQRYPKEAIAFILASFVNAMGNAFMWPLTTLFVHNVLHRSYGDAGLVILLQALAGIVGQFLGGTLYHRLGVKVLIVGSLLLSGILQISLMYIPDWSVYVIIMMVLGLLNSISFPAVQAFIGFRWPERRRELFNVVYVGNNIGMAIGSSLGGLLAAFSFTFTFLFNGVTTLGFAAFFFFYMTRTTSNEETHVTASPSSKPAYEKTTLQLLRDYRVYLFVAIGAMLIFFANSIWGTGIAPFLNEQGMSAASYSILWTVNGIVIFAGQPVTTWIKNRLAQTLQAQLIGSAVCYAAGFALIFISSDYYSIVAAMIITTLGEMLKAPTIPAFITEHTGNHAPFYLGLVGGLGSVGRLFGPYVQGNLYDIGGLTPLVTLATVAAVLSVGAFVIHAFFFRSRMAMDQPSPNDSYAKSSIGA